VVPLIPPVLMIVAKPVPNTALNVPRPSRVRYDG
jgi:hypothetical protein